jgi:flagellar basal body-associated protein FliL
MLWKRTHRTNMAKETQSPDQSIQAARPGAGSFLSKRMIMIGVPVFILQVALLYFLMVKFMVTSTGSAKEPLKSLEQNEHGKAAEGESGGEGSGQSIFVVKDLMVNPAGTNGTRFLLTTVGFEVNSPEGQRELERKEVQVRDVLNTILTSKGLDELIDVGQREELRTEISRRVGDLIKSGSLTKVYFSKFVIQ